MNEQRFRWRNKQLREHVAVMDGKLAPTKLIKHATYLNVHMKEWMDAHIWIYQDRIIYVGEDLPETTEGTEVIDAKGQYLVPGYVEPHAHPFQLYNPQSLAHYATQTGTTTLVNDNLMWLFLHDKKKAFSLLEELAQLPASVFWWSRYDSQSMLQEKDQRKFERDMMDWLEHDAVIQGGELTAWPEVMNGDDQMLHWMQETTRLRKPIEGHLPGSSDRTLTKMMLLGVNSDHESMTADDVLKRLRLGYNVGLRYSSIRPDLPEILKDLVERGHTQFDHMMMTTDGSTPSYYRDGVMNTCIQIAIDAGVPVIDAYLMGSYNAARHFQIDHRTGSIAPGRVAHINFLNSPDQPAPHSVLAKGEWIRKDEELVHQFKSFEWEEKGVAPVKLDWDLTEDDLQFSTPVGLEMANDVIMKPYPVNIDPAMQKISKDFDESFLMLVDREGEWRVNTLLKGFTTSLGGLVSTYSNTGDIILTGKNKGDMKLAFQRMKEIGGGIVLAHEGEVVYELPLRVGGKMTDVSMETLIEQEKVLADLVKSHGYQFGDPVYTLLFLSSVHLPFIRVTPAGIIDVKKKEVLFPAIMR
ncbi:adenine deaminase C-terminal domain-containing protein [Thalassobacillus hwangdonensis]|uniref:adenine deaminase n=1 Tax=Thalassobacillus hwangdonensis TaxID=546108 RepID=A0ABW3L4P8_9BACI